MKLSTRLTPCFGKKYASYYDFFYSGEIDYQKEVEYLVEIFGRFHKGNRPKTVAFVQRLR